MAPATWSRAATLPAAAAGVVVLLSASGCGPRAERAGPSAAHAKDAGGWEEVRIGTDAVFNDLRFVDRDVGWIVGGSPFVSGGVVGRTEDGGRTWRYHTDVTKGGPTSVLTAVHAFDRERACVASSLGIFLTFDGGGSWQPARVRGAARYVTALDFLGENEGWAAGATGVLHTSDAGLNWTAVDSEDSPVRHVASRVLHFTDPKNGWLAGQGAALYRSRDGGATWARVVVPTPAGAEHPPYLFGAAWPAAGQGWLVGEYGTILHTADGGESWTLEDAGTHEVFFTAVAFVGRDGWIAGFIPDKARSVVCRSTDGGTAWAVERTLDGEELRALQMLDADTGWAVGDRVRADPQRMLRRRAAGR